MQRMKQLARTAIYWPGIDAAIVNMSQQCSICAHHQDSPAKAPVHPWIIPEKPWIRLHIDHAVNFMGHNWLVVVDAFSKYPCIHKTSSTSSRRTMDLLEEDFAHFGYPLSIVSDNATSFTSGEFQEWCKTRGIAHLTGAPYHPATNGATERMVQTFKKAMKKSNQPLDTALQQFLMMYRRTPSTSGFSPSELLNGRQLRTRLDALTPSPAQFAQLHQQKMHTIASQNYEVGQTVYARCYQPPSSSDTERWVEAVVTKKGARNYTVLVHGRHVWRRHTEQLRPRHLDDEHPSPSALESPPPRSPSPPEGQPQLPEYGCHNPRRSQRQRRPNPRYQE